MESPIVGTFVMCFSSTTFVGATKFRRGAVNNDGDETSVVAITLAIRANAALPLDASILIKLIFSIPQTNKNSMMIDRFEGWFVSWCSKTGEENIFSSSFYSLVMRTQRHQMMAEQITGSQ